MSYESEGNTRRAPSIWLWLAAACALCSAMSMGSILGWSSPGLPSMGNDGSEPYLGASEEDENNKSWIGSSTTLGALVGGLLAGPVIGLIGMKKSLIALGFPFILGWICILFAKSVWLIIVGRVITGFGAGIACGVAPTYCNQISTPNIRGLLGTGFQIFVNIGILYIDLFGISSTFNWRWLCIPAIVPAALMSCGMIFLPESPVWLIKKYGRSSQVVDALRRLRSEDSDIETELKELQERDESEKNSDSGFSLELLKRADVYKPMIISLSLMVFQQFSGINAVLFYAADIFKSAGSKIDPNINAVIVTGTMVVAVIIGGLIIDKLGRKILLLISGGGHVITLVCMGYYFYHAYHFECPDTNGNVTSTSTTMASSSVAAFAAFVETNGTFLNSANRETTHVPECDPGIGWLPVVSLVIFVIAFSLGFGPIPWMITAEITPGPALSFVSSLATGVNWGCAFIVTNSFKKIQEPTALNKHGAFWMFAGVCAASIVFTAIFVPESKGKSPEEMSRIFLGQENVDRRDNKYDGNKVVSTIV